jgi:hypothetical protein
MRREASRSEHSRLAGPISSKKAESGKRKAEKEKEEEGRNARDLREGGGEAMAVPLSQALSRMGRGSLWRFGMDREEVEVGLARTFPGR